MNENKNIPVKFHISKILYQDFYTMLKKKGVKVNDRIRQLILEDTEKNKP